MAERWPDLTGRFENATHVLAVRVYHEDTDFTGVVYHATYLKFCERGRSDCLRLLGIHHDELHGRSSDGRLGFVVRRMRCDFHRPARIADKLEVHTRLTGLSGARLTVDQTVARGDERLFEAEVILALIDERGRPRRIPAAISAALRVRA
ncbi:MAG: tol-pal system-associated acyl-CoA thioesterase [Pseudomonadota bacterium]|nr:tol-pal system-associated acyl-CoA thioesterase [Pseudomonadota bacterium]